MNNQEFTRRKFLQISGLSSMSLLLGGCGTPMFEDLVGKFSEPLNRKFEELIFQPQKPVPEFLPSQIEPNKLIINSFESTPIIDLEKYLMPDADEPIIKCLMLSI